MSTFTATASLYGFQNLRTQAYSTIKAQTTKKLGVIYDTTIYLLHTFAHSLAYYIELCLIRRLNICNAVASTKVESNDAAAENANKRFCLLRIIYGLFNDAVRGSAYTASSGKKISEELIGKDVEGIVRNAI
jgi:hypothetical protein